LGKEAFLSLKKRTAIVLQSRKGAPGKKLVKMGGVHRPSNKKEKGDFSKKKKKEGRTGHLKMKVTIKKKVIADQPERTASDWGLGPQF